MSASPVRTRRTGCCTVELTETVEQYLKGLFDLCSGGASAGTAEIARMLGVSSPTVTAMLHRLRDGGLVQQAAWGRVQLTGHGQEHACAVVRRHRLLETFLHDVLGVGWEALHAEAETLEHGMSEHVEDLIDAALAHPRRDPHGDPIPPKRGPHDEGAETPLTLAAPGDRFRVLRVRDRDSEALRVLAAMQIGLGTELDVIQEGADVGSWWVRANGRQHVLRPGVVGVLRGELHSSPTPRPQP